MVSSPSLLSVTALVVSFAFSHGVIIPYQTKASNTTFFGVYFGDWSQYHQNGYAYTATDLAGIIDKVDELDYAFLYFCPPKGTSPMPYWSVPPYGSCTDATEYQLMSVDPHDDPFLQTIIGYKSSNPKLRVILSIGGWNFPSEYFSAMVSTAANRATFIASVKSWIDQGYDGISIDWEYPCSPPRMNSVEISCTDFQNVNDAGGKCPDDGNNFVSLLQEMRQTLGNKVILTVASQAGLVQEREMKISSLHPYVDRLEVMSYDYTVSDIPNAGVMAPNAPLYTPNIPNVTAMSINYTVTDYLNDGVPAYKIVVGVALYGHSWYNPTLGTNNQWTTFGNPSYIQGDCCGPFMNTYGGKPGQGSSLCGSMMYSEILAAAPDKVYFDNATQSNIGYFTQIGKDGYTPPGTWITYNDPKSMEAIVDYCVKMGVGGIFAFDASMDSRDPSSGAWTYELMNTISNRLGMHNKGA